MQAPSLEIGGKAWDDKIIQPWSGVHVVASADLHTWSLPQPSPKGLTSLDVKVILTPPCIFH
jgi:hypothetical protein